jgi:proline iminopeptidase
MVGRGPIVNLFNGVFFNPSVYRIVLFDQRGAGRSIPTGSLQENTTWDLLHDMEIIRKQLDINGWVVFGGSWGATLGLLYAQQYPDNVLGLILRGTFLARERDIHWVSAEGGVHRFFPKQWQAFTRFLPKEEHWNNPLAIYYELLTGKDTAAAHAAALAWAAWSGCVVSYGQFADPSESSEALLNRARIECHYMFNRCFLEENQLLREIEKVADTPAILVHGQRDLVCPLESSYLLEQNWPAAQLKVIAAGGHLAADPEMISALVEATDEMVKWLDFPSV